MNFLYKIFIGKNLPHLGRVAATFLGSLMLFFPVFAPAGVPLDPVFTEAAEIADVPTQAEVEDGLTIGEFVWIILGSLMVWATRFLSWWRARWNPDFLARYLGPVIGRSITSLFRATLVGISALLTRFLAEPAAAPEVLADRPLATVFSAIGAVLLANWLSATEDGKRNPKQAEVFRPADLEL